MKCCDIGPSKLRERITIERKVKEPDGMGGFDTRWTTRVEVPAMVHPLSSSELIFAGRLQDNISHRVVIRYRDDLDPSDRIVWRGQELKLSNTWINVEARNKWLEGMCTLGVALYDQTIPDPGGDYES